MGCLFEMLLQIFIEGTLNVVMYVYLKLACIFVPENEISKKTEKKIRNIITTVSALLFLSLLTGVSFLTAHNATIETIGKYLTFISLIILGMQIVLGIIVTVAKAVKHQKSEAAKSSQKTNKI
ncbi:MAG: hypothetical protein E7598_05470 [Ruminococcaceae bacterium]|nr:hypothetical protein [Oscillospiraceae bacterium]